MDSSCDRLHGICPLSEPWVATRSAQPDAGTRDIHVVSGAAQPVGLWPVTECSVQQLTATCGDGKLEMCLV